MNYQFDFGALLPYWQDFLSGALTTIEITVFAVIIGMAIGVACAIGRRSNSAILRSIVSIYIETVRNTPFIVQIFFILFGLSSIGSGCQSSRPQYSRWSSMSGPIPLRSFAPAWILSIRAKSRPQKR